MESTTINTETSGNISNLKQLLRAASDLVSEGIFQVEEDGLHMVAADPAMVGLIDLKIKEDYFDTFEVEEGQKIGINLKDLYNFIKSVNNDETLGIKYGEGESQEYWELSNDTGEGLVMKKGLTSLNLSEEDIPSTSQLSFKNEFQMDSGQLKRVITLLKKQADSVNWVSHEDGLTMDSPTGRKDHERFKVEWSEGEQVMYGDDGFEEETHSMFSLDYLETQFSGRRIANLTDKVTFQMGDDFPLKFGFENENFSYQVVVAPRIEEEDF